MSTSGEDDRPGVIAAEIADRDLPRPGPSMPADGSARGLQMAPTSDAALEECVRLRSLVDGTSGLIAVLDGPDHVFKFANSAWPKLIGGDVIGRPLQDVLPHTGATGLLMLLDSVRACGHAGRSNRRHTVAIVPAGQARPVHLDFVCRPMTHGDGVVQSIVLEGADVTDRVLAEEWQKLLLNEMAHRVKNNSATMIGLARLARSSATDLDSFLASLTDRIVAMCKTQDRLTLSPSRSISVNEVLGLELQPYLDQGVGVVDAGCEDLMLTASSAVSLSMIVHELLTNALKYGALSVPDGRLRIGCEAIGRCATLTWSETALQPVGATVGRGFGSRLIERLARSMGGRLCLDIRPGGLDIVLTFEIEAASERP